MASPTVHDVAMQARRVALEGVNQRAHIHYTQAAARWQGIARGLRGPAHQPDYADCSAYTTWCFWTARVVLRGRAGTDIVNGTAWKSGYTGTQIQHGRLHHHGVGAWYAGRTLVFYGRPTVEHVALYVGNGKVVSHGTEAGPLYLDWDYRPDFSQARAYTV
jgi:cell wall-associated NlpC family hydrolase